MLTSHVGIGPVNWFPPSASNCRLVSRDNSGGISPVNWLRVKFKRSKLFRLPNSGGMVPVNWLSLRTKLVTRSGEPLRVTSSHAAMAVEPDQFSVPLPARVSRAASSASQSATRPGLLAALGTASEHSLSDGSLANPCPQVLLGSGLSRCSACSFR